MTKTEEITAADVLLACARKSGFLERLAEAMLFIDRHRDDPTGGGMWEALYDTLDDMFDNHCCEPAIMIEGFYGDGICVGPFTADELAPYLDTSTPTSTAA